MDTKDTIYAVCLKHLGGHKRHIPKKTAPKPELATQAALFKEIGLKYLARLGNE